MYIYCMLELYISLKYLDAKQCSPFATFSRLCPSLTKLATCELIFLVLIHQQTNIHAAYVSIKQDVLHT
jgi:hypothetical protein